jgi:hypothetical protein
MIYHKNINLDTNFKFGSNENRLSHSTCIKFLVGTVNNKCINVIKQ